MASIIEYLPYLTEATVETLYMTFFGTLFSYVIGLPLGAVLTLTKKGGLKQNLAIYKTLDIIINILRSAPFFILIIACIPLTRLIVGTALGSTAVIVPLVIAAAPYVARTVENSLADVDRGVIESAQSMGASPFKIVYKVLFLEARPSLIYGAAITATNTLGYSAMAGAVGGGGLGNFAFMYGFARGDSEIMLFCLVLLIVIVQIIQLVGLMISRLMDMRR